MTGGAGSRALLSLLAVVLLCEHLRGGPALGGDPVVYSLHIASQPLDTALQDFSRQSGVQIVYFSKLTAGLRAPALDGRYTLDAALLALLKDSQLTIHIINAKTVEIRALPANIRKAPKASGAATTDAGELAGSRRNGALEEIVVSATVEGLVASRIPTPLRAIPQTVAILSAERLHALNNTDLADALSDATGITAVRTSSVDRQFYSRGFKISSYHVDGGAALFSTPGFDVGVGDEVIVNAPFLPSPDLSEYEQIEVLRGADALFAGTGNPGGTVSMVRKRPRKSYEMNLDVWTGSWHNHRVEVDVTGPVALDGALRGRLDAVYVDRDYFFDTAKFNGKRVFAALEYELAPATFVTGGASYQRNDSEPFVGGLPRYADGSDAHLSRDTALTFDWATHRTRMHELYIRLQHQFHNDWKLNMGVTGWRGRVEYAYGMYEAPVDSLTQKMLRAPLDRYTNRPSSQQQSGFDITLTNQFEWFGRRQELAIGADITRSRTESSWSSSMFFAAPLVTDPYDYDPSGYPDPRLKPPFLRLDYETTEYRGGAFASLRAYLNDDLSVVAGARISSDRTKTDLALAIGAGSAELQRHDGNTRIITPYAGATYDVSEHFSLYASYADTYRPLGVRATDAKPYDPAIGTDLETGIKAAWYEGALNGTLAFYKIDQPNIPLAIPVFGPVRYPEGTNQSRGLDLELDGRLQPAWLLGAGYTYNFNDAAAGGPLSSSTPRHLLKLWTRRQLHGNLNRLTIGGDLRAQSGTARKGTWCPSVGAFGLCAVAELPSAVKQGAYFVLDLRAAFQIDSHWSAALTVNNVFDKVYYETIGTPDLNNWFGEPRSVLLRVGGSF